MFFFFVFLLKNSNLVCLFYPMVQLKLENLYFNKTSNISKTRADREKLMAYLKSAHQIYIKTTTNTPASKCVLTSVIIGFNFDFYFLSDRKEHRFFWHIGKLLTKSP